MLMCLSNSPEYSIIEHIVSLSLILKRENSKSQKDIYDTESSNDSSSSSILLSSDNESISSSNERIQSIEYQMSSLKKKIEILRTERKAILMKKKIKSARKSQKIKSYILRTGMKSLVKDNYSSIQWNTISENSKTSNSLILEPSNEVKYSWNNSNSTKASSCPWTEVQTKTQYVNQSSFWEKKFIK